MTRKIRAYEDFTPTERAQAIHDAYRDLKKLELSEHPRAVWSAGVLRKNIIRLEAIL